MWILISVSEATEKTLGLLVIYTEIEKIDYVLALRNLNGRWINGLMNSSTESM